jgi:hypothetical protein
VEGIQVEDNSSTSEAGRVNANYLIDNPPAYESPPDYEAPPNYEEAIKMYKESTKNKDDILNIGFMDIQSNCKFLFLIWNSIIYIFNFVFNSF